MKLRAHISPVIDVPAAEESMEAVRLMRQMFARTLSSWAVDVLALRRSGTDELVWQTQHDEPQYYKKAA